MVSEVEPSDEASAVCCADGRRKQTLRFAQGDSKGAIRGDTMSRSAGAYCPANSARDLRQYAPCTREQDQHILTFMFSVTFLSMSDVVL